MRRLGMLLALVVLATLAVAEFTGAATGSTANPFSGPHPPIELALVLAAGSIWAIGAAVLRIGNSRLSGLSTVRTNRGTTAEETADITVTGPIAHLKARLPDRYDRNAPAIAAMA